MEMVTRFGNRVFSGDPARSELLRAAGAERAKLLVITIDDPDKAVRMIEVAKSQFPHLKVLTRTQDRPHTYEVVRAGTDFFAREYFGSAMAMGERALTMLGVAPDRAHDMADRFEEQDTQGLMKLYEVWGDDEAYGSRIRQNVEELQKVLREDELAEQKEAMESSSEVGDPDETRST